MALPLVDSEAARSSLRSVRPESTARVMPSALSKSVAETCSALGASGASMTIFLILTLKPSGAPEVIDVGRNTGQWLVSVTSARLDSTAWVSAIAPVFMARTPGCPALEFSNAFVPANEAAELKADTCKEMLPVSRARAPGKTDSSLMGGGVVPVLSCASVCVVLVGRSAVPTLCCVESLASGGTQADRVTATAEYNMAARLKSCFGQNNMKDPHRSSAPFDLSAQKLAGLIVAGLFVNVFG